MSDFKAKMHRNPKFGWGSAPDPAGGAYSALPDPLDEFKGHASKGRGGEGRGWECCGVQKVLKIDSAATGFIFEQLLSRTIRS